ncbi:MAG: TonB-dependent receptor [Chitinophagaceae bacterium]|nr:TonB-dependent receptor [Chitinophagaceae bacterium]
MKRLSVEELMNIEVTSVSRMPQKLTEVASALQVITGAEIQRSGATNIPDALKLLSNLQVAEYNSSAWIISSRGFNTIFANKLLVMIDGRSIYTPLFGGVIWDLQNLLLEDVDRIEVVSGPGGTLWGANAVNGVINIITKKARETQGTYISASAGNFIKDNAEIRHGGRIGPKMFYRIYGQHFDRNVSFLANGNENSDAWGMSQAGFRLDWTGSPVNTYTVQGDFYAGSRKTPGFHSNSDGQNVLARWNHTFSPRSGLSLQVYYDRYFRDDVPSSGYDKMKTYDLDFQYSFPIRQRQSVLVGFNYRMSQDEVVYATPAVAILPPKKDLERVSGFIQDEIRLLDSLKLTVGTKLQHHFYAGFGLQPSVRLAWTFRNRSTLWAAVSRALRTASRFDVDIYLPAAPQPPTVASVAGGPNFVSEKVLAYELGYRIQPSNYASFSAAAFYNVYGDVYSVEPDPGTQTYRIQNGSEGKSWGLELSGGCQLTNSWKLRGGYTFFRKDLRTKPGHVFNPDYLGNDAENQVTAQSILDIFRRWHLDISGKYIDHLPATIATPAVAGFVEMDLRLAVDLKPFEIAVVGQNLLHERHVEFGSFRIPRSVYFKIACRF